jgi:hypothetical protein
MAEQSPVPLRIAIDAAAGCVDDPLVFEVGRQSVVVCGKRPRAADNCQGENMMIIGRAAPGGAQTSLLKAKVIRVSEYQPSSLFQCDKAATRFGFPRSPRSQATTALGCARYVGATFASTMRHTSDTQKIALFLEEKLPEASRWIRDAAVRVEFQVVNRGAGLPALEVKQRDVFRPQ